MSEIEIIKLINEKLSYSLAYPDAESFTRFIQQKEYVEAHNIIKKHVTKKEAIEIINYYKKEAESEYVLKEISLEDFNKNFPFKEYQPMKGLDTSEWKKIKVVLNYRGRMLVNELTASPYDNQWMAWNGPELIRLEEVSQIWLVEYK